MNKSNALGTQPAMKPSLLAPGILQRKCECGNHTPAGGECAACGKQKSVVQRKTGVGMTAIGNSSSRVMQAKLSIGASDDPLEREADRVADQVLAAPARPAASVAPVRIQRFTGQLNEGTDTAPASVDCVLASSGRPIEPALRQDMEQRFGHDFSRVRVHAGAAAEQSAREVNANAYTVGHNIVFGAGQFAPRTDIGRRLLAHELTHVVQQTGIEENPVSRNGERASHAIFRQKLSTTPTDYQRCSGSHRTMVQRDLATPPPAIPLAAQTDLTDAQIDSAIQFNRVRYDATSTRLIQDLVGTTATGIWIKDDILAIAMLQEEYGFKKDGMVGPKFFRFLDEEIRKEKINKTDKNCLVAFRVIGSPQTIGPVVAGSRSITGNFEVRAQFPKHCGCADYEYRQFIRGHWRRERGGVVTDLGATFTTLPGGAGLPAAFIEDGNTALAALNYGHRTQPAEAGNQYLDDKGVVDQANGCNYESEDTPGGADNVLPGDVFDIDVNFRGEIQRGGRAVRTQQWVAIRGRFPVP